MKLRLLLLCLICLLFTGCSKIGFIYYYADWLVEYRLNQYIDLDSEQEAFVSDKLDLYFVWHRKTMLPVYANSLKLAGQRIIKDSFSDSDYDFLKAEMHRLYEQTVDPLLDDFAYLLTTLSEEQVEGLQEEFSERNDKMFDKSKKDLEDRHEESIELVTSKFERWFGDLTDDQTETIEMAIANWDYITKDWVDGKILVQKKLVNLIKSKAPRQDLLSFITICVESPETLRSPELIEKMEHFHGQTKSLILLILKGNTEEQKKYFIDKISRFVEQLIEISKDE